MTEVLIGYYSFQAHPQDGLDEITGGSRYGSSTITGNGPETRWPSENELAAARFQGRHGAQIARKLSG